MSDESIKVTDKRMFTPEGELREEYRFLEDQARERPEEAEEAGEPPETGEPADPTPPETAVPGPGPADAPEAADRRPADFPESGPEAPGFFDLLRVLAEPVPFYLGDAALPTGEREENLEAARFYIDLIDALRQKTAGNLTAQEAEALEDVLYRLRVRYVEKRR